MEVCKFLVYLFNVYIKPEYIVVTVNSVYDSVVESVELLEEVQLLLYLPCNMEIMSTSCSQTVYGIVKHIRQTPV